MKALWCYFMILLQVKQKQKKRKAIDFSNSFYVFFFIPFFVSVFHLRRGCRIVPLFKALTFPDRGLEACRLDTTQTTCLQKWSADALAVRVTVCVAQKMRISSMVIWLACPIITALGDNSPQEAGIWKNKCSVNVSKWVLKTSSRWWSLVQLLCLNRVMQLCCSFACSPYCRSQPNRTLTFLYGIHGFLHYSLYGGGGAVDGQIY